MYNASKQISFKVAGQLPATLDSDIIVTIVNGMTFVSFPNNKDLTIRRLIDSLDKVVLTKAVIDLHHQFQGVLAPWKFKNVIQIDDQFSVGF